jgi:hypothetical protein
VTGYTLTMQKQERIKGRLNKKEVMEVWFRDQPHSVLLKWKEGARLAAGALYVEGENGDQILVKPYGLAALAGIVKRNPEGADARNSGRYTLKEFGLKKGLERTLNAWTSAKKKGELHVEYKGKHKVEALGGRLCYEFKRTRYAKPEEDGVAEATLYIDVDTWILVGSILKNTDGQLIAEYYFRDIRLNPKTDDYTFTEKALRN